VPFSPSDQWLLPFLKRVSVRPGMFLGDENVKSLASFIHGYTQARIDLGLPGFGSPDSSILDEFEKWLAMKLNDTRDVAWQTLIMTEDPTEKNVQTFFSRFEEFLRELGDSLSREERLLWPP